MLISITIGIMILLTIFAVILGSGWATSLVDSTVSGEQTVDGVTSTFELTDAVYEFQINEVEGAIIMIILIATIGAGLGVTILGSGLNSESIRVIIFAIAYTGIWGVLSVLVYGLITSIEIFGPALYIGLTLFYVIGVIQKISGS